MTRTLLAALVTLGDPNRLTGGYLYHRRLADLAPREHARLLFVSFPERPFPLGVLDGPRILAEVQALGSDVLVLDSIAAAFAGPALVLRRPSLPIVGMLHQPPGGIDHGPLRTRVQARLDRLAYRSTRRLLAASDALADQLRSQRVHPSIAVVPPGRDVASRTGSPPADGPAQSRPGVPALGSLDLRAGRRAAFLCVGNWVERKGLLSLLEAFAGLPPEAATLHLVGDQRAEPAYAARVRERLARADLAQRVVVHGPRSVEEVAAFYATADAFVLPSLREPYGTVYGEAMAFGLPVVGWRAGNLPYLAEHEREGLLLEPGDLQGLRQALQRLAEDADLRQRLGAAARARAASRPTWQDVGRLFFAHLRAVLSATQGTSPG